MQPYTPSRWDLLRELGVARDAAEALASAPRLLRQGPNGGGRPVMVVPGFRTGDTTTAIIRGYLARLGFRVRGWGLGINNGQVPELLPRLTEAVERYAEVAGGPVALVGWSLGGYLSREVARDRPDLVVRVVTLGSPIVGGPKYTQAALSFKKMGVDLDDIEAQVEARNETPIVVPITAVYSRVDGVVAWPACVDGESSTAENIEVQCTHAGFGFHPEALEIVAERLSRWSAA